MNAKRLVFYNDARHYHLYCHEPPISLAAARAPVDELAGTHVDTFVYGPGAGPSMFYLTKVGEVFGSHLAAFRDIPGVQRGTLPTWRAHENIMSLKERGIDLMELLAQRAHEADMKFIVSYRQTHSVASDDVDNYFNWQFKIDHPEWCLKGKGAHGFNFIYPEVRAERFALAQEAANDYDIDGLEIDWCFWPYLFEEDQIAANRDLLTDYMRQHREMLDAAAARKGRPLDFGARVLPTLKGNLDAGFDVAAWLEEDLLDFVVPNYYVDEQIDADFPFEWLVELAAGTRCQVWPAMQRQIGRPKEGDGEPTGEEMATASHYHAAASAYYDKGADGIYLPWFNWPIEAADRQLLSEIDAPDLLAGKPGHYAVRGHNEGAAEHDYHAQLPLALINGTKAPGQPVKLFVAAGAAGAAALLRLRLRFTTIHDRLWIALNGFELDQTTARREPHSYTPTEASLAGKGISSIAYTWLEIGIPAGHLRAGANEVAIAVLERPAKLEGQIVLDRTEVVTSPAAD